MMARQASKATLILMVVTIVVTMLPSPSSAHPISGHRYWDQGDYDTLGTGALNVGDQVGMWQSFLAFWEAIPCTGVDGHFGPQTEEGTAALQFIMFLNVDGVVGPNTWGAASERLDLIGTDGGLLTWWGPDASAANGPWPYYKYVYGGDWEWSTPPAGFEQMHPSDHPAITFSQVPSSC